MFDELIMVPITRIVHLYCNTVSYLDSSINTHYLTLSDFRTDKSVRKWRPAVTFVRIYPYTDIAIEMGRFKRRRLKTTLRYL